MKLHEIVTELIQLAGGELVGRIRLQKILYLLDHKGLNSGAGYVYYHYGPYSDDLWDAVADAKFFDGLTELSETYGKSGAPFSVFKSQESRVAVQKIGVLTTDELRRLLAQLKGVNSTVLELAATIHWLAVVERVPDWRTEIESRKAGKTGHGRLDKALGVLTDLGLAPAA